MNRDLFRNRMQASALSLWELGDLLGIHPHHLHTSDTAGGLSNQPVHVLIELARRLDLHPADLIPALDAVLTNRRTPPAAEPAGTADSDALTVLTALSTTSTALDADELAAALTWTTRRTAAAIEHAADRPHLGGPVALRRVPPGRWTVTTRRDILTPEQQTHLAQTARYRSSLTTDEANVLLAAYNLGHTPAYADWRPDHHDAEHTLKDTGLISCDNGPHRVRPSDDVMYSLGRYQDH